MDKQRTDEPVNNAWEHTHVEPDIPLFPLSAH